MTLLNAREKAFAAACFSARRWPEPAKASRLDLTPVAAQGLSDLLPILICGEASAELVFADVCDRFPPALDAGLQLALRAIAEDERRHGAWLAQLRAGLPAPTTSDSARRAAGFLHRLASADPAVHLTRVASLDAGVCIVLAEVCAPGAAIAANAGLLRLFRRIRRDEGRHVRISRRCAAVLGVDAATEAAEHRTVIAGLADLLAPQNEAFEAIGVDVSRLKQRFRQILEVNLAGSELPL